MQWFLDYVPWWVTLLVPSGGLIAGIICLFVFFPPAAAMLVALYNRTPLWVKAVIFGLTAGAFALLAARQSGVRSAEQRQKDLDAAAMRNRVEVDAHVDRLSPSQVDDELERHGDFVDDPAPRGKRR